MVPTRYPVNWAEISSQIKEANDWLCQECGRQCRRPGEPFDSKLRTLTVAHYDHDYDSPEVFLVVLCTPCHLRHDAPHSWPLRRYWAEYRRQRAGQIAIWPHPELRQKQETDSFR